MTLPAKQSEREFARPLLLVSEDVLSLMHKRHTSLRKLALQHGLDPSTLTKALRRGAASACVEKIIADACGLSRAAIFPPRMRRRKEGNLK